MKECIYEEFFIVVGGTCRFGVGRLRITQKRMDDWNIIKSATSYTLGKCGAEYQYQCRGEKSIWDNSIPRGDSGKGWRGNEYTKWLAHISTLTETRH